MSIVTHKIDGMPPQGPVGPSKAPNATGSAGHGKPVSPIAESNPVSLSSEARQMQTLHEKVADVPEVDMARVEAVKSAIASGRFRVDPEAIASGLINMERALKA